MRSLRGWTMPAAIVAVAIAWLLAGTGLVSSNDGSHVALARAFTRGEVAIDDDVALTLWVDRAVRDGHDYSDRPPGTAFAAVPAVWIGAWVDPLLWRDATQRQRTLVTPAARRYVETYVVRAERHGGATPLAKLQGTVLLVALHAALVGALGLLCVDRLLARRGAGLGARVFAVVGLGLATLWGPYSTALFSHVTTGTLWIAMTLALARADDEPARALAWRAIAGLLGGWAVASDYSVALPIALQVMLVVSPRAWPHVAAGAVVPAIATAAYHHAAFGAWHAIGYQHHASFEFARTPASTFSGDPLAGLWTLLGLGRGAGVLARAPLVLLGVVGLVLERRWREGVAIAAWVVLLAFHRTPWGGASEDHRYLVPAVPLLALGFATTWQRWVAHGRGSARVVGVCILVLTMCSAVLAWGGFVATRDG
jgi:hypothetical protein